VRQEFKNPAVIKAGDPTHFEVRLAALTQPKRRCPGAESSIHSRQLWVRGRKSSQRHTPEPAQDS
jgi:hypothetical protein